MDEMNKMNDDNAEASSDGEDYESADEGESTKGKSTSNHGDGGSSAGIASVNIVDSLALGDGDAHCQELVNVGDPSKKKNVADLSETRETSGQVNLESNSAEQSQSERPKTRPDIEEDTSGTTDTTTLTDKPIQKQDVKVKENLSENTVECTVMKPAGMADNDKGVSSNPSSDTNENHQVGAPGGGWGSWGSWGAVLNQATATVTSGLSHVIESVESSLGIPEPGELVEEGNSNEENKDVVTTEPTSIKMDRVEDSISEESPEGSDKDGKPEQLCGETDSFLSSWGFSSLSEAVTSRGLELVTEGIDALETIGKKTMHVISEGDPGLRNTRNMFQKPTLSQTLREAKEQAAKETAEQIKQDVLDTVNFNDEFDGYQGLAHLEALEILSKESENKIESMLTDMFEGDLEQAKVMLLGIENVFTKDSPVVEDVDEKRSYGEFAVDVGNCAMALNLAFVPDKLNETEEAVSKWLEECVKEQGVDPTKRTTETIYSHVITSLANITAKSIEAFRRVAEMILVEEEEETVSAQDRSVHLYKLMKVVTYRISSLSTSYAECLNMAGGDSADSDNITPVITEVYLESSNSSSHVQDAFKLLLPVLQVSALNNFKRNSK